MRFIEKRRWWSEDLELVTESWQQYRAIVAPELSWDDWHGLATAALAVDQMRALQAMARREGLLYHTITEDLFSEHDSDTERHKTQSAGR